jgi:hypothetical protein
MRLLNVEILKLSYFAEQDRPPYVVASHRRAVGETTLKDVRDHTNTNSVGCVKVTSFANFIRKHLSLIKWLWMNTCCINKDSDAELTESTNSMFEWYRDAELCFAYLSDVDPDGDSDSLGKSERFKGGWTRQELLAPRTVFFLSREWQVLGRKR